MFFFFAIYISFDISSIGTYNAEGISKVLNFSKFFFLEHNKEISFQQLVNIPAKSSKNVDILKKF